MTDDRGRSAWSEPAFFETAFLDPGEFTSTWIGRAPEPVASQPEVLLRKRFDLRPGIARARVYMSALGYGYLHVNGDPASDELLPPAFTQYDK